MPASGAAASGGAAGALRQNAILAGLPAAVWADWLPRFEVVPLDTGTVIYEAGASPCYVWFPLNCAIAVIQTLADGASAQIAVVGREGLVGAPVFLGASMTRTRAMVQAGGSVARIATDFVLPEFERGEAVMRLLLRHTQAVIAQMAQIAACNRYHAPEQQFCRWLLMALDRADLPELRITQEMVATLLGVRRETVSEVTRKLQKRGAIECRRGWLRVLDRPALERGSCECYASLAREYARLFSRKP